MGISERLAQKWLSEHGEDYVRDKLALVDAERKQGRVKKTPAAYLAAAIKGDYQPAATAGAEDASRARDAAADLTAAGQPAAATAMPRDAKAEAEAAREALLAREAAWRADCLSRIDGQLEKRSPASRKAMRDRFERLLQDEFEQGQFRRYGWHARAVFAKVYEFWEDLLPEGLPSRPEAPSAPTPEPR